MVSVRPSPHAWHEETYRMRTNLLDQGLQWFERLLVFADGDTFERFTPRPARSLDVEAVGAVLMVLAVIGSAAGILAKIVL